MYSLNNTTKTKRTHTKQKKPHTQTVNGWQVASKIPTGRSISHYMYWDQNATRCLIRLRGERELDFDGNNGRKGQMWMEISDRMAEQGYDFGVEKVSKKWHNIMMTYHKNVKKKQQHGRVNWEYFQDLEMYYQGRNSSGTPDMVDQHGLSDDSLDASDLVVTEHAMASTSGIEMNETEVSEDASPMSRDSANESPQLLIRPTTSKRNSISAAETEVAGGSSSSLKRSHHQFYAEELKFEPHLLDHQQHQQPQNKKPRAGKIGKTTALKMLLEAELENGSGDGETAADGDINNSSSNNSNWIREYLQRKLELERERLKNQQDRHRDRMNFQKMTLMVQEKMEKSKVDALRSLTDVINRLT